MSWTVRISRRALADLDQLRAHDSDLYLQAYHVARSIERTPFDGMGSPVRLPLIGPDTWFRHLSLLHRIVYEIYNDTVIITSFRMHVE